MAIPKRVLFLGITQDSPAGWNGAAAVPSLAGRGQRASEDPEQGRDPIPGARSPLAGWLVAPRMHSRHMRCRRRQPLGMVSSGPRRDGRMNGQTCGHLWDGTG